MLAAVAGHGYAPRGAGGHRHVPAVPRPVQGDQRLAQHHPVSPQPQGTLITRPRREIPQQGTNVFYYQCLLLIGLI